jgi:hypothetical protein
VLASRGPGVRVNALGVPQSPPHSRNESVRLWRLLGGPVSASLQIELVVESRVDRMRACHQEERIAVGRRATASVPIVPPAPGRLSMTNGWPRRSDSHCAIGRARMSLVLPAGKVTTIRTGRAG